MVEFDYDERGDALSIFRKGEKVKYSVEVLSNYIIDVDFKGNIAGIEILNASESLGVEKNDLMTIRKADLSSSEAKGGAKKLLFCLELKDSKLTSRILVPLSAA